MSFRRKRNSSAGLFADARRERETHVLEQRVTALQDELDEQERLYRQALEHIAQIETAQREVQSQAETLERANVRVALLMQDLEEREQLVREQHVVIENHLRRAKDELDMARDVQQLLLPARAPAIVPGLELTLSYEPAAETGGDWIGFDWSPDHRELSLLIGDVTGHGAGAALLAASVSSALATLRALQDEPSQAMRLPHWREPHLLLRLLDRVVGSLGKQQLFMTCFAAVFHADSRTLRYANAGHCTPLVVGRDGTHARTLHAAGNQLGTTGPGDTERRQHAVQLSPGELLLFYTDGLVEACARSGQELGRRRLAGWLRDVYSLQLDDAREQLRERLLDYVGGQSAADDTAFVLARVHTTTSAAP